MIFYINLLLKLPLIPLYSHSLFSHLNENIEKVGHNEPLVGVVMILIMNIEYQ